MTENESYIIELSKAALFDINPVLPSQNIDWNWILDKCIEQNIAALLAISVLKLPIDKQPKNVDTWKNIMLQTISLMGQKNAEFERIIEGLKEINITPLCLKGIVIKDLYPIPELRTMGDFDIMVDRRNFKTAENFFESKGYTLRHDTLFTELDFKGIHGELFSSLEDDFRYNPEKWDNELKQNMYMDNNRYLLSPSYELAYSVVHASKHLTREGCGIRNLFDVIILLKEHKDQIDISVVEKVCASQGYEKILYYMLTAAEHWYGIEIPGNYKESNIRLTELFLEFLLCYGIFGHSTDGNVLSAQVVRREGDNVSTFRRIFFPPRKMMWHKYQYLKKSPLLLPIAWIHRFFTAVFIKKYPVTDMIKGLDESITFGNERNKWLDKLEIK